MANQKIANILSTCTTALGSVPAVCLSVLLILVWLAGALVVKDGILNDSYQLLINSATTIITFIMVFIIQNTTNRETKAMNAKMDALLKHLDVDSPDPDFRTLIGIEDETEEEIDDMRKHIKED